MFCISELIKHNIENIDTLALSDSGNMAVVTDDKCGLIFDPEGKLINKVCGKGKMKFVSYSNGRFGFINGTNQVIITDDKGKVIKTLEIEDCYADVIGMGPDGFVACKDFCGFYDFSGKLRWTISVYTVITSPMYYRGYWFIADYGAGLLIVKDKRYETEDEVAMHENDNIVKEMPLGSVFSVDVCGNYLVVSSGDRLYSTSPSLYLFDITNPEEPKELWSFDKFIKQDIMGKMGKVAFGPDCRYFAVVFNEVVDIYHDHHGDMLEDYEGRLEFYSITGRLIQVKKFKRELILDSLEWKNGRVALAIKGGPNSVLLVYKVKKVLTPFPISP